MIFPLIHRVSFYGFTLWLFNIAMVNGPFIDDFPSKTSVYGGFSMAMLNNQMVWVFPCFSPWFPLVRQASEEHGALNLQQSQALLKISSSPAAAEICQRTSRHAGVFRYEIYDVLGSTMSTDGVDMSI